MVCFLFVCSFGRGPEWEPPENTGWRRLLLPLPGSALYFGALSMFAYSHSNLYCYVMFHCIRIARSICSFYHGWTLGIFPIYRYYKKCSNSGFPHLFVHTPKSFSNRRLEMELLGLRAWASSTALRSINRFPEHLSRFPPHRCPARALLCNTLPIFKILQNKGHQESEPIQ